MFAHGMARMMSWFMLRTLIVASALLINGSPSAIIQAADLNTDADALLLFRKTVATQTNRNFGSWNESNKTRVCDWYGVICNGQSNRVTNVQLPGKALFGQIPNSTLGNLDALQILSLRKNNLSGQVLSELFNCSNLQRINLFGNRFSDDLSAINFATWPRLLELNLSSNQFFSVQIPDSLASLKLTSLALDNNNLSGSLPANLNATGTLLKFNVSNNNLTGAIPAGLARADASSFAGNPNLCGPPLTTLCNNNNNSNSKLSRAAIIGIVIACIVIILLLIAILRYRATSKKKKESQRDLNTSADGLYTERREDIINKRSAVAALPETEGESPMESPGPPARVPTPAKLVFFKGDKLFSLEQLLRASAEVLGKGSFGGAYKASLEMGLTVVVKRLRDLQVNEAVDYRERIQAIAKVRHRHLVGLLAYYFSPQEKLLVVDYVPDGSLSAHLHGNVKEAGMEMAWEKRLKVAATVAKALAYLHNDNDMVHGSVKSSNVLIDEEGEAMVADYGLVQLAVFSPTSSNNVVGYIAPEVTDMRRVTKQADVYSFGVLLLELLTGRPPNGGGGGSPPSTATTDNNAAVAASPDRVTNLPRWVLSTLRESWSDHVLDPAIVKSEDIQEQMLQLLDIAVTCVSHLPDNRPSIHEVVRQIDAIQHSSLLDHSPEP